MAEEVATLAPSVGADAGSSGIESAPPTDTTTETSTETISPDAAGSEAGKSETDADGSGSTETEGDSRLLPQDIRALKETNPALYKQRKAEFFELRNWRQFGKPSEVAQRLELLDQIGGEAGWMEAQEFQESQDRLNKQYASTDPEQRREFARGLFKDNPQAARAMAPHFLEEFHRAAPQEYSRVMSRIIANTFNQAFDNFGVKRVLASIKQKVQAAGATVPEEVGLLEGFVSRFEEIANARSGMDEEREAFEREKQEFQTNAQKQENQRLTAEYQAAARRDSQSAVRKHLGEVLKGNMPDSDVLPTIIERIEQRIAQMVSKDETFIRQRNQILARKDADRARKFVLAKFNQLLPEAAKQEIRMYNFSKRQPAARPTPTGAAPAAVAQGWTRIAKQPEPALIDYRKSAGLIMSGKAILKDGRKVQWD